MSVCALKHQSLLCRRMLYSEHLLSNIIWKLQHVHGLYFVWCYLYMYFPQVWYQVPGPPYITLWDPQLEYCISACDARSLVFNDNSKPTKNDTCIHVILKFKYCFPITQILAHNLYNEIAAAILLIPNNCCEAPACTIITGIQNPLSTQTCAVISRRPQTNNQMHRRGT